MEINEPVVHSIDEYKSFVGVKFDTGTRAYFFGVFPDMSLNENDLVVVETVRGLELGTVVIKEVGIENYKSELGLKPVLRIATDEDLELKERNLRDAAAALDICKTEVEKLGLDMHLISCEYTLDRAKVIFSYLADERVDFRELLKVLAAKLRTRIELRQIGTRDKAKMIGGIGLCGLPLCCSTFLNEFEGISITRAKNQMLSINIPKLSGHCGKLLCCLKFEDEAYTEEKKKFPSLGEKVRFDDNEFTVSSYNIISTIVKIENGEDIRYVSLKELKSGKPEQPKEEVSVEFNSDFLNSIQESDDNPQEKETTNNNNKRNNKNNNRKHNNHNNYNKNKGNRNKGKK